MAERLSNSPWFRWNSSGLRNEKAILSDNLFWVILCVCAILKLWLIINSPLIVLGVAAHDDALFMKHAENLLNGKWLGGYDQLTLAKGPGYGWFLASVNLSGLPLSLAHGLLLVFSIALVAWALFHLTRSRWLALLVFVVLVLHPVTLLPGNLRVIRDQIYTPQTLIIFAVFAMAFLANMEFKRRIWLSAFGGAVLGWAWLTREEGIWFLPGLVVLAVGSLILTRLHSKSYVPLILVCAIASISFLSVNGIYRTGNYMAYGAFTGVDFKETNFTRVVNVLQNINSGPRIDYVPVSKSVLKQAANVSKSFQSVSKFLDPDSPSFKASSRIGCRLYKHTCGEIAGGWFVWALRTAAQKAGFYKAPAVAKKRFGLIADELETACRNGLLNCKYAKIDFVPQMSINQIYSIPASAIKVLTKVTYHSGEFTTAGRKSEFADGGQKLQLIALLNHPKIRQDKTLRSVYLSGWYYDKDSSKKPQFKVKGRDGNIFDPVLSRRPSPDIAARFNDVSATRNRLTLQFPCDTGCQLIVAGASGSMLYDPISPAKRSGVSTGSMKFHVDKNDVVGSYVDKTKSVRLKILQSLDCVYKLVNSLVVYIGIAAYLIATTIFMRGRYISPLLVFCSAMWTLVAVRVALLSLIDATSFPAASYLYATPVVFIGVVAGISSTYLLYTCCCQIVQTGPNRDPSPS